MLLEEKLIYRSFSFFGGSIFILNVINNSKKEVKDIEFFYENSSGRITTNIKSVKGGKAKQIGISTISARDNELKMIINGKIYRVSESICRDCQDRFKIKINNISDEGKLDLSIDKIVD
ncbi:hypothetical protein [Clostridium massiliamazoniense]|uniref:hypothetical protein n=1 Tax=Clostridium massiliamazoniense TaxID=1347366 RepID=UPI0006D7679B|nr:hypothetical protein [Clostridium massiliamazoniense]